jgi:hypothetical protein
MTVLGRQHRAMAKAPTTALLGSFTVVHVPGWSDSVSERDLPFRHQLQYRVSAQTKAMPPRLPSA